MPDLPEASVWHDTIHQVEDGDPVMGGVPDRATKQGGPNIAAKELADRTRWLKAKVEEALDKLTGEELLGLLAPVDGNGSALDADTVDGKHAAAFVLAADLMTRIGMSADRILHTPVHPLIQTASRTAFFSVPAAGTVRIAATPWLWRGVVPLTVAQKDFATAASKTYHLRASVDPATLVVTTELKDLASAAYNPGGLPYDDASFDAGYEQLLLADIVTDAGNVATITPLANAPDLTARFSQAGSPIRDNGQNGAVFRFDMPLAWARAPVSRHYSDRRVGMNNGFTDLDQSFRATNGTTDLDEPIVTRRGTLFSRLHDFSTNLEMIAHFRA